VFAGRAGAKDNVSIGDFAQIGASSIVLHDVPAGEKQLGFPAHASDETMRVWAATRKLPDLLKHVRELESRLAALESSKTENH
jgi:UDP-3-O-[3-hydroxymyristoyl] glucosamine N-acyltransferase